MEHIVATELTAKELLNQIATRLDGMYKSYNLAKCGSSCLYRSESDNPAVSQACGVGLCLPDELAKALDVSRQNTSYYANAAVIRPHVQPKDLNESETDLLMTVIQHVHDNISTTDRIQRDEFINKVLDYIRMNLSYKHSSEDLLKKL